jgi:hypothetical protein
MTEFQHKPHLKFLFKSHKKVLKKQTKIQRETRNQSKFSKKKVNKSAKVET